MKPDIRVPIANAISHPNFEVSSGHLDFAVVLLEGQLPGLQPLPVSRPSSDLLEPGDNVEIIGYGDTELDVNNTLRRAVVQSVSAVEPAEFSYDQRAGGPCLGDSGGPAVARLGSIPTVVGVTSYGRGDCWSEGISARVSAAFEFLAPYVDAGNDCGK